MNSSAKKDYSVRNLQFNPGNAHYNHIFVFADAATPSKCFCIITLTPTNSDRLLNFMKSLSSIGDLCTVIEPDGPARALGNQPIIGTNQPLVPVESSFSAFELVPLLSPEPGQQRCVLLKKVTVIMSKVNIMNALCQGELCDRQGLPSKAISCSFLFMSRAAAIVIQMSVTFSYSDEH